MKKYIIAIWGNANNGKSATVKKIAQLILDKFPNAISEPNSPNYDKDIKVIIQIGKIKIGIESQGDPNSRHFKSLKEFVEEKCDLILCTTRTYGSTVNAVNDMQKTDNYEIIWATNYRSNENLHEILNDFSSKQICELIENIIANKI
jgi:Cdc6-like AAA superfamily ATPase